MGKRDRPTRADRDERKVIMTATTNKSRPRRGPAADKEWELRLYVAGANPKSLRAFANLKRICEEQLAGSYHIEVIDLLERPQLAKDDQIIAVPTLVRKLPEPLRKIIGDLSDTSQVLVGLQIVPA